MKYFSYDPDGNGFQFHKTAEAARQDAEVGLSAARDEAWEGWSEESMYICWGKIHQQVVASNIRPATEDDCVETDMYEDRNLEDVDE